MIERLPLCTAWERRTARTASILAALTFLVGCGVAVGLWRAGRPAWELVPLSAVIAYLLRLGLTRRLRRRRKILSQPFPPRWEAILQRDVVFFRALDEEGRKRFRRELQVFLGEKRITGIKLDLDDTTRVLAAASAIIPIFGFPEWEWDQISEVLVYPNRFDRDFDFNGDGRRSTLGMVGSGALNRLMILSKPDLLAGFRNPSDKRNVGLHEFAHLVDKSDGTIDGLPGVALDRNAIGPWIELVRRKMEEIRRGDSDLDPYGLTNEAEFFAVATEYFFERPGVMQRKHPELYVMLSRVFRQNLGERAAALAREMKRGRPRFGRNSPCPCGSGVKYKKCCLRRSRTAGFAAAILPALLGAAAMTAPSEAAPAPELPPAVAEHPAWIDDGVLGDDARDAVRRYLARGKRPGDVVSALDFLDEARSPVADGDHGPALVAFLGLAGQKRRFLRGWIERRSEDARHERNTGDLDDLLQLQTRISVVTSEIAGRAADLVVQGKRGKRALQDLRSLAEFADTALWERHALNWRLRGPLRLGTAAADRTVDRFYRKREHERFSSADRARYVKVLTHLEGGGFDALNAYDRGGISLGIAQFSATSPYLGRLLQHLERERPRLYRRHVRDRGVSVEPDGWLLLEGRPAIAAIREMADQNEFNDVLLAFIDSLESRRLRRSLFRQQVVLADHLLDRAMVLAAPDGTRPSEALETPRGLAHLADAFVNAGANDALGAFEEARRETPPGNGSIVDAFVEARIRFYERTGQAFLLERIEAIEREFPRQNAGGTTSPR